MPEISKKAYDEDIAEAREEGREEGYAECITHLESMAVEATSNIDAQVYWRAAAAELVEYRHVGAAGKVKL